MKPIRLSANILNSSLFLLKRVDKFDFSSVQELVSYKIDEIDVNDVFRFCEHCGWCISDKNEKPSLTERGQALLELAKGSVYQSCYRLQLFDYIEKYEPIWRNRIPYGRQEAFLYMTEDEKACFEMAKLLLDNPDISTVRWWDSVSQLVKKENNENKLFTGRKGELCTIEFEKNRTLCDPVWKSIDSNMVGYDIISVLSSTDHSQLYIETKTTEDTIANAFFHISSNEWQVAKHSLHYAFYLWVINASEKLLAIIDTQLLAQYIPSNNLEGEWESARIPFNSFKDLFKKVVW